MTPALLSAVYRRVATSRSAIERNFIMARTSTAAITEPKTPAFQAGHVTDKGDDSFWTKVGAAWPHRDGKGLSLILSVIPMNGQIVLRRRSYQAVLDQNILWVEMWERFHKNEK
jgi:hypothetical protein